MGGVPGPMTASSLVTAWSVQPVAVAATVLLAGWYADRARRRPSWPARRWAAFAAGVVLLVWTTCGWPQAYGRTLFWVFTTQVLLLLLVVPIPLMAGRPVALLRRPPRFGPLTNPLVGPLIVPAAAVVLLFGPVPGWAVGHRAVDWLLPLAVLAVGAVVALPLTEPETGRSALAIGAGLALAIFELLLDAVPGIVMRLSTHLVSTFFDARGPVGTAMAALPDQQRAGAILWAVAEALDFPFLAVIFVRWVRADARDAAAVDTVLDAEEVVRQEGGAQDEPWWVNDPVLRERFRR
jgi:putative copper resistance protein D